FDPKNLKKSLYSPYVVIPHIEVNGKGVMSSDTAYKSKITGLQKTVKLKHNQNDIKFNFASLCYNNPEKINYKYRLVGYNDKWSYTTGNHPFVNYTNLKYGTYHFICYGTNQYGEWSEKSAKLTVVITPPWFLTKISIFLYFIITALIIYCIYYYSNKWIHLKHELSFRERLHTTKIQFFTNISHELRTPLALIMMPLKELRKKELSVYDKQLVELIFKNTTKISHIIDELLEFRKLEEHMNALKLTRLNLNYAIKEIALEFTNLAQQKNIDFEINYSDSDIVTWLDTYKVERIVTNLLVNSIKYTKEGGKIELTILPVSNAFNFEKNMPVKSIVKSSNKENEDYFALVVKDSGKGIPAKLLLEIFNPFYQLPEDGEYRTHGNGIGLAIVKGYIKAHRGELLIASKPGVGTEIMIKLPKNDSVYTPEEKCHHQKQPEIKNTKALPNNPMVEIPKMVEGNTLPKILLVEDHEELRLYLKSRLLLYYDVIEANNGKDGLALARKHLPDIIITDIEMPIMNGIELIKTIRQKDKDMCIIVLTAYTNNEYLMELIDMH
ncbi:MAG: ATP-binding protein, partial [Bacteroidales bacterium]|nr:ATP-binding protein [Bacteroidales bacterium]